jgi:septal ring factor EnvC (AmiA/AmiB activator)
MKFPLISALLGLASESEALTDTHMTNAEAALGQLQTSKASLETTVAELTNQLATATTDLGTAQASLTSVQGELATAATTIQTLEAWKNEQAVVDGRTSDASTQAEQETAPKAAFESEADELIAKRKAILGL